MLNDQGSFGRGAAGVVPDALDAANRRADQRHMSVFRVGKMITDRGQELCLIRNISSGGLMAHIYSPHEQHENVEIELKAGRTVKGKIVWARDRKIGVEFDEKIDVADVLAPQIGESDPDYVARSPRLNIATRGRLRVGAHYQLIELRDISQGGAKFSPAGDAAVDDEVILLLEGLPPLAAVVRWRHDDTAGVTFKTSIPFEQLAAWAPTHR
ncbi:MAG: PilZ domain-containing protein [Sphingomonadaceae bacterium]